MATTKSIESVDKSVKNATTKAAIFNAIYAAVRMPGAIAVIGSRAGDIIAGGARDFVLPNGQVKTLCNTNKFVASFELNGETYELDAALEALLESKDDMDIEEFRQAAYALRNDFSVDITLWDNTPKKDYIAQGVEFMAIAVKREYKTKDGDDKVSLEFTRPIVGEIKVVNNTFTTKRDIMLLQDEEAINDSFPNESDEEKPAVTRTKAGSAKKAK